MAGGMFGKTIEKQLIDTAGISMESETLVKVMLAQSGYTPNYDTHDFRDDVTNEPGNSGTYASGGSVITTTELTVASPAAGQIKYTADNVSWTSTTITASQAVGYLVVGAAGTDMVLWDSDFGGNVSTSGGTFSITWHATNGILYIDYVP